jgi:FkbM family methyltransferase
MAATVESLSPADEQLDLERVVEVDTDVGTLWLERDAEILTPTLLDGERWEPDVTDLLRRLLRPGMTVVDAGANIGYLSVHASKLVGPTGRVFCVEADPANVAILRTNLWRNGCTNAVVLPVAAWSERAELNLSVIPEGGACTHVSSGPAQESTVAAYRLDEMIDGRVDYLKVDCEGTDHLVLRGATGLFRTNPRLIATVEFVPDHDSHTGHTPRDILGTYRELGLKPYWVSARGHLRPTSYSWISSSGSDERLVVYDFALSLRRPTRLVLGYYLLDLHRRAFERLLRLGGDLLEYVPARIRPRIRRRDRARSR